MPTDEDNARDAEKWELSWLKYHNFFVFKFISTKLGGKVYIKVLNGCVNFHSQICTRAEISTNVAGGGVLFVFIL